MAWLLAYLLYPIVKFVENKLHVRIRALSIIITMIFVVSVVSLIVYLIIPPMIDQFQNLCHIKPLGTRDNTHQLHFRMAVTGSHRKPSTYRSILQKSRFHCHVEEHCTEIFNVLSQTASIILSIVASLITLLYMFFILMDYEYLTANWIRIFPPKVRPFGMS